MKKFYVASAVLVFTLGFFLAGCGNSSSNQAPTTNQGTTQQVDHSNMNHDSMDHSTMKKTE